MIGDWGNSTQQPWGWKQDKRPGGIPVVCSVAFLGKGGVYLQEEPILLQEWPEGDSRREEGMFGVYHRFWKLATSSVWLGTINS